MGLVRTYATALDVGALDACADAFASCADNFWIPRAALEAGAVRTALEAEVVRLYHGLMRGLLPPGLAGAEFWVQVYEPGRGLAFHFDKDEQLFRERREMAHPLLSTILYLVGDTGAARLGPTVVVAQHLDSGLGAPQPEVPSCSALVWPCRGLLAVFEGRLGHGVLAAPPRGRRATLLVNWWDRQPQGVEPIPADVVERYALGPAARQRECAGGAGPPAAASVAQAVPVAELHAPTAEGGPVMVDDLLAAHGLRLVGAGAVSAAVLHHTGFQLFPLDEDALPPAGEAGAECQTAAALVPLGMLPADSCSDSSSGSEDEAAGAPAPGR